MIEAYDFGFIVIDGRRYTTDVIVRPEGVKDGWWRQEGHRLHPADLEDVFADPPEVLVVGTGYSGRMVVPPETETFVRERGVELVVAPTREAVQRYNELAPERKVVAALHLTC
jgi:hypothetical protein